MKQIKQWLDEKQQEKVAKAFDNGSSRGFKALQDELAKTGFYKQFFE